MRLDVNELDRLQSRGLLTAHIRHCAQRVGWADAREVAALNDRLEYLSRTYTRATQREMRAEITRLREIERAAKHMNRVMNTDLGTRDSVVIAEAADWLDASLRGVITPQPDLSVWEVVTMRRSDQ